MTDWVWLIGTQINEIDEHTDKMKIANEYADIIGICVQAIQEIAGEDNVKLIIGTRIKNNIDRIPEIAYKYRKMWEKYETEQTYEKPR